MDACFFVKWFLPSSCTTTSQTPDEKITQSAGAVEYTDCFSAEG